MKGRPLTNDEGQEIIKAASFSAIDTVAAGIDLSLGGTPLASGAWGLAKAILGKTMALRQKKALEWVEMIRDNPSIFTLQLLEAEEFQDAFVTSLEGYIKERSDEKRGVLRAIFLDYSVFPNPQEYPLERLNEITKQLTVYDAKKFSYLVHLASEHRTDQSFQDSDDNATALESALRLISLGLLIQDVRPRFVTEKSGPEKPHVYISGLGIRYLHFIKSAGISYENEK